MTEPHPSTPTALQSKLQSILSTTTTTTAPESTLQSLLTLNDQITSLNLYSPQNETIDDISTSTLPLLSLPHHIGMTYTSLPTTTQSSSSNSSSRDRFQNIKRSMEYHYEFLRIAERCGFFFDDGAALKDYHKLLNHHDDDSNDDANDSKHRMSESRDEKIARFQRKRHIENEVSKWNAMKERRNRLGVEENESLEGVDEEGLSRKLALAVLKRNVEESIDELLQSQKEVEMLKMAMEMEMKRVEMEKHKGKAQSSDPSKQLPPQSNKPPPNNKTPIQLTKITQNAQTGQLQITKEQLLPRVFQPGWNQPTMSLQQYGDIETQRALERSEQQKVAEEEAKALPRRYEQLVKDGMEDDAELVEQSTQKDREWDEFREENPRGWGNKMVDRGDRNF